MIIATLSAKIALKKHRLLDDIVYTLFRFIKKILVGYEKITFLLKIFLNVNFTIF